MLSYGVSSILGMVHLGESLCVLDELWMAGRDSQGREERKENSHGEETGDCRKCMECWRREL